MLTKTSHKHTSLTKYGNNFKYQRNVFTILLQKPKFDYFIDLHVKDLSKNKKIWKKDNIFLKEKGDLITDNPKLAYLFNTLLYILLYFTIKKVTLKVSISL